MLLSHFHTSHTNSCKRKVYRKVSVEDKAKNLVQTYNKENKIVTQTIGTKVITYKYDFQSKRVSKTVVNGALTTTEYYVRDPQGNVLAIYSDTLQNGRKFTLSELHIYGSSRLGTSKVDSVLWENGTTTTSSNKYSFKLGQKRYELSNHLGNVSTTISDRKLVDVQTNGIITAYKSDVQSVTDYYPFGKTISERTWSISKTRYDFNGKETDAESGYQDYGFRDYDVEICRFLQVDPLYKKYPWNATYCFAENKPVWGSDLDGLELNINDPVLKTQFDKYYEFSDEKTKAKLDVVKSGELNKNVQISIEVVINEQLKKSDNFGITYYDFDNNKLVIALRPRSENSLGLYIVTLADELEHAYQFLNGDIGYAKGNTKGKDYYKPIGYDVNDELASKLASICADIMLGSPLISPISEFRDKAYKTKKEQKEAMRKHIVDSYDFQGKKAKLYNPSMEEDTDTETKDKYLPEDELKVMKSKGDNPSHYIFKDKEGYLEHKKGD